MNLANKLTISRFLIIPIMLILTIDLHPFFKENSSIFNLTYGQLIISILFIIASFTDFLDGYIARKTNSITTFGKFLDPIADKALVVTVMIYLVSTGDFQVWIISLIVLREFLVSGLRLVAVEKNIVIAAGKLGKQKTFWTMLSLAYYLFNFQEYNDLLGQVLVYIMLILTLVSGIEYIYKNKQVFK
jgi:CDP-diacylglycerol--glycerol-3-phosphate 3-phosphatidyltransferase